MADHPAPAPKFDVDLAIQAAAALSCPNMTRERRSQRFEENLRAVQAEKRTEKIRRARLRQDQKEVDSAKGPAKIWRLRNLRHCRNN